ncbi:MAG TPA: hypothetical protein VIG48_12935 [Jatrophihabitans sp.]|jgi:flagellar basal body-associated protein FliL
MISSSTTLEAPAPHRPRAFWIRLAVFIAVTAVLAGVSMYVRSGSQAKSDNPNRPVPTSSAMEQQLGVRFSRVAVVADGGLVTVFYVVLDSEKASVFESDAAHRPVLVSESRHRSTAHVALMKQGHTLREGQTYYLVYDNSGATLRPGEQVTITWGGLRLRHVPVL